VTQSWFLDLDTLKLSNGFLSNLTWKVTVEPRYAQKNYKRSNEARTDTIIEFPITRARFHLGPFPISTPLYGSLIVRSIKELPLCSPGLASLLVTMWWLLICARLNQIPDRRYPVTVLARSPYSEIDIAVLEIEAASDAELIKGSAENLRLGDPIAISGFPNYRLGDTGYFNRTDIVGFRIVRGIRRLLINAGIVAGNGWGPGC
jgi:hypothetical protein